MKRRLKEDYSTITSARKREEAIKNMWIKDMDAKYFQNLADSMPKGIEWVKNAFLHRALVDCDPR
jgi:hypothetical protein